MKGRDKRALALKYEKEPPHGLPGRVSQNRAPRVTAKGKDQMAERIELLARENGVPVMNIPHLANSLFEVDLGAEIPEEFYSVTAEILSFVFSLEEKR